jgi:hypothetical protein
MRPEVGSWLVQIDDRLLELSEAGVKLGDEGRGDPCSVGGNPADVAPKPTGPASFAGELGQAESLAG